MVAINAGDPADVIRKYRADEKFTFTMVMGGDTDAKNSVFSRYAVSGFPTNYLVDPAGKIVWRAEGFDEDALKAALAKLGVK